MPARRGDSVQIRVGAGLVDPGYRMGVQFPQKLIDERVPPARARAGR